MRSLRVFMMLGLFLFLIKETTSEDCEKYKVADKKVCHNIKNAGEKCCYIEIEKDNEKSCSPLKDSEDWKKRYDQLKDDCKKADTKLKSFDCHSSFIPVAALSLISLLLF